MPISMKFGAGSFKAGMGPAGIMPAPPLPDERPPMPDGVPAFDVSDRDYRLDEYGRHQTVHPYDQQVQMALGIKRGQLASAPDQGHLLNLAESQGGAAIVKRRVENQVAKSVSQLVSDGKIRTLGIEVTVTTTAILVAYRYQNLGSTKPEPTELRYTYVGT